MLTAKLQDSTPTTTITFKLFKEIAWRLDCENFEQIALPENEGRLIIHLQQSLLFWKVQFELEDDATWPGSGDSATDKFLDLVDLIESGGDSEGLFTLTFDRADMTGTLVYTGKVKNLQSSWVGGETVTKIQGEFEFWESDG